MSRSLPFSKASRIAFFVISWKTILLVGILGLRTSTRCQLMLSPSRSSSVARISSSAPLSSLLIWEMTFSLVSSMTYFGL